MLIHEITPRNILSFGPDTKPIKLGKLNVLIGANGSGKSNLIDVISVLQAAPDDIIAPIRKGGGIKHWLWQGRQNGAAATINTVIDYPNPTKKNIRHIISLNEENGRSVIESERIERESPDKEGKNEPYLYYKNESRQTFINSKNTQKGKKELSRAFISDSKSAFNMFRDIFSYPEITDVSEKLKNQIKIYRNWQSGRDSSLRQPQSVDTINDFLLPDANNLALIMNKIDIDSIAKENFIKNLRMLYDDIQDYKILVESATAQIFLKEKNNSISATRLSDGTLRYMCLLAILCHPKPPALICIDEPELGLHPDVLPSLANLLIEASERTQIIVTTHSEILVDAMTEQPESVLVTEKIDGQTSIKPLDPEELKPWLKKYRLGELWTRGDIGGNRW